MELERVFKKARQTARTKIFDKEDQVELAWLEKEITDVGFGPLHELYIKGKVHEYATIIESKGKLRRWAEKKRKHQQTNQQRKSA